MTDFELVNQMTDVTGLFYDGFALLATLLFAYVSGTFYFLHRAPVITKIMSFSFLVFAILFVMNNSLGVYFHLEALIEQIEIQASDPSASHLIHSIANGRTRQMVQIGLWSFIPIIVGTVAMCFWMTFMWDPQSGSQEEPRVDET